MEIFFRVTGILCGEFTGPGEFPAQRPVTRSFDVLFDLHLNKRLSNNREAGDLRRCRVHYHVIVMHLINHTIALILLLDETWKLWVNISQESTRTDFMTENIKTPHKILNPVQYNGWGTFCFG